MAQTADSVVVELEAKLGGFTAQTNQAASQFDQSMDKIAASAGTAETAIGKTALASNQSRIAMLELQHVVRGSADSFASGTPLTQIFAQHVASIGEAAVLAGGSLGKVGAFLGGPWGLALTLATTVAATLAGKLFTTNDTLEAAVEKLRKHAEQTNLNAEADKAWSSTIDGLIDRNLKLIDTLQKRLKAEEDLDDQTLRNARNDLATAEQAQKTAQTHLDALKAQQATLAAANSGTAGGQRAESLAPVARQDVLISQIAQAERDLTTAKNGVVVANEAIARSEIAVGEAQGKAAVDATAAIDQWSKKYTAFLHGIEQSAPDITATVSAGFFALEDAFKKAASANIDIGASAHQAKILGDELKSGKLTAAEYANAMEKVAAALIAAAKAAADAKKGTGELGKQISFADAEAIARGAGLTVTSGQRTDAQQAALFNNPNVNRPGNPVARPVSMGGVGSAHEGLNGKWALDIAFAPGLTPASLKKLYGDQGVSLSAVYKESGHYHIEGSRSQAAAADNAATRDAQKQVEQQASFASERDKINGEMLISLKQVAKSYEDQTKAAINQAVGEHDREAQTIASSLAEGKYGDATSKLAKTRALELTAANDALLKQREANIALEANKNLLTQMQSVYDQSEKFQIAGLQTEDQLATTQEEHRRLQLQILDIVYQQKDYDLRILLAKQTLAKDTEAAAITQREINNLPVEKAQQQKLIASQTAGPGAQFLKSLPSFGEEVQSLGVDALKSMNDEIAKAITGAESLGQAFSNMSTLIISELAKVAVEELIIKPLASALFGNSGTGGGGIFSSLASLFGGGGGGPVYNPNTPGLASGGPVSAGSTYLVGERGPELFKPSQSGAIVPNGALASGGLVEVRVYAGEGFDTQVLRVTGPVIAQTGVQAARGGASIAQDNLMRNAVHRLGV